MPSKPKKRACPSEDDETEPKQIIKSAQDEVDDDDKVSPPKRKKAKTQEVVAKKEEKKKDEKKEEKKTSKATDEKKKEAEKKKKEAEQQLELILKSLRETSSIKCWICNKQVDPFDPFYSSCSNDQHRAHILCAVDRVYRRNCLEHCADCNMKLVAMYSPEQLESGVVLRYVLQKDFITSICKQLGVDPPACIKEDRIDCPHKGCTWFADKSTSSKKFLDHLIRCSKFPISATGCSCALYLDPNEINPLDSINEILRRRDLIANEHPFLCIDQTKKHLRQHIEFLNQVEKILPTIDPKSSRQVMEAATLNDFHRVHDLLRPLLGNDANLPTIPDPVESMP